jgi:hypothetical protein
MPAEIIEIDGRKYIKGALERQICKVCGEANYPNLNGIFWQVTFEREVEEINGIPGYEGLKADYFGAYLCNGCLAELLLETPEVLKTIQKVFPQP